MAQETCPECGLPMAADITTLSDSVQRIARPAHRCSFGFAPRGPVMSTAIAPRLLDALGLPIANAVAMSLELEAGEAVKVTVQYLPSEARLLALARIVREFELVPAGKGPT